MREKNQPKADSYTNGKTPFKLAGRDAKHEFRTVINRRQKEAPGQVLVEHRCSWGRATTRFSRKKALKGRQSNLNMILKVSVERVSLARTKLGTEIHKVIYTILSSTDLCVHVSHQDTNKYFQIKFLYILKCGNQ